MGAYQPRLYREGMNAERFRFFSSVYMESDMLIGLPPEGGEELWTSLRGRLLEEQKRLYRLIIDFEQDNPGFTSALEPFSIKDYDSPPEPGNLQEPPPEISLLMECGRKSGTGPMSAVAGLFARQMGGLIPSAEVVVENGGDLFLRNQEELLTVIHAGTSPLSGKIGLKIPSGSWGLCTSSGTLGHSFSRGKADALSIVAASAPLADAWATSLANHVQGPDDIDRVLALAGEQEEILSCLVVVGDRMGICGDLELSVL